MNKSLPFPLQSYQSNNLWTYRIVLGLAHLCNVMICAANLAHEPSQLVLVARTNPNNSMLLREQIEVLCEEM